MCWFSHRRNLDHYLSNDCFQFVGLKIVLICGIIYLYLYFCRASVVRHVRLIIFATIVISCLPLLAWSACFFQTGYDAMPYCKNMFITGDKDL